MAERSGRARDYGDSDVGGGGGAGDVIHIRYSSLARGSTLIRGLEEYDTCI